MSKFTRVSIAGSDELFRPTTRPRVLREEPADAISEVVDRGRQHRISLSPAEIELLLEAIHAAKYPDRAKRPLPLEKFERYDALRDRLQQERNGPQ